MKLSQLNNKLHIIVEWGRNRRTKKVTPLKHNGQLGRLALHNFPFHMWWWDIVKWRHPSLNAIAIHRHIQSMTCVWEWCVICITHSFHLCEYQHITYRYIHIYMQRYDSWPYNNNNWKRISYGRGQNTHIHILVYHHRIITHTHTHTTHMSVKTRESCRVTTMRPPGLRTIDMRPSWVTKNRSHD